MTARAPAPREGFGLVLAGGAARGAYQAGVLRFLTRDLARQLGFVPWPDIVSGTSVGSLNGVFMAARDLDGVARLDRVWQNLRIDDVYRFGPRQMAAFLKAPFRSREPFALLDGRPLAALIQREFPTLELRRALDSGATRAFIVSATELATGRNTLFVDTHSTAVNLASTGQTRVVRTRVSPEHCLASASIPFMFQPVVIDGRHHVDGGLRMNTPLRPVLRSGANRALVVSLLQGRDGAQDTPEPEPVPNLFFLAGKTFNALLLDPVERDLHAANLLNRVIAFGEDRVGTAFRSALAAELDVHHVDTLFLRPSLDLGELAADRFRANPPSGSPLVRLLLHRIADRANRDEADLLSYLFFDRAFTGEVEQLGYEDARRVEADLVRLIGPEPTLSEATA